MEKKAVKSDKMISRIIYILFIAGAIGYTLPSTRHLMVSLTPILIMVSSMLVLFYELKEGNLGFFIWGLMVASFILFTEAISIRTGLIYGWFTYGSGLGARITDVPVIIGINSVFLIAGAAVIASYAGRGLFLSPLLVSVFIVIFDLFLEAAAVKLGYINWQNNIIPLQNYYAWIIISYFISFTYYFYGVSNRSTLPAKYFIAQLLFFCYLLLIL